jgi:hypothetical protein
MGIRPTMARGMTYQGKDGKHYKDFWIVQDLSKSSYGGEFGWN